MYEMFDVNMKMPHSHCSCMELLYSELSQSQLLAVVAEDLVIVDCWGACRISLTCVAN